METAMVHTPSLDPLDRSWADASGDVEILLA
jgi:hypothetical protein